MKYLYLFFLLIISNLAGAQTVSIIPQPVSIKEGKGKFIITKNTVIATRDEEDRKAASFLNQYLKNTYGFSLDIDRQESRNYIRINTKKFIKAPDKDAYTLTVNSNGVTIEGDTYAGSFYGMQTLIQLLPLVKPVNHALEVPFISIQDYPRFDYRGTHLDVGRHFFPPSFIRKYLDYLALHKINYFHWHLTEDQGWRIEIKKYPNLVTTGAWRDGTIIGRYPGKANDNLRYGGYYTQEEVKEIVKYAADRHITVIPEIEMPGHSSAAIASYPWLSCFPEEETIIPTHPSEASKLKKGKKVQETWGVFNDVYCAGNDSTFLFLQDVLDEVIPLFPSKYVHVGGDECPKANWKRCPRCQSRIKSNGLKNEHELQSYFIQRMEKYVNSKGKTIIGWDEILEGGLAPNAIVMSWQGEKGGIEAVRQKHFAIMCPEEFAYLNWSQTRYEDSVTFGRFTPVEKVYNYDPIPKEITEEESRYVMGIQGNVWTEYIKFPSTVEYNIFPRLSAIAETGWTPKAKKNWSSFEKRLPSQFKRYELWKAHYSNAFFEITPSISQAVNGVTWKLESKNKKAKIMYAADNKKVQYTKPLVINKSLDAVVTLEENGKIIDVLEQSFYINKATSKKLVLKTQPMGSYKGQGEFSLVNGVYSKKDLIFPDWLGWAGADMDATINLGKQDYISSVKVHMLDQQPSWIYLPQYVEVFVSSNNKDFKSAGRSSEFITDTSRTGFITIDFPRTQARYVKIIAKNFGTIPTGQPGAGSKSLLFADEIQVY